MKTVTIQKLSKTYLSGKEALKELSLTLSTGEVFGFLGPNGAGKTTTVKLLTGVLSPSGGSCEIMGVNPNIQPEKVHLLSGIVTEHAQMYDNLTGTLWIETKVLSVRYCKSLLTRQKFGNSVK